MANQLLLPIVGDADLATLELSPKEEAIEAKLKKRMTGNAKLSYWVSSSSKFSMSARCAAFVAFWLCKFVFESHPYYAIKPLYFRLTIKIAAGVSLPLASMFLEHLYVQLNILRSDESQAGSCHIATTSVYSTILQQLLFERCAQYLAKCRPVRFAKEKYQSCPKVITDFCSRFESVFPLAFSWSGLKPINYFVVKVFNEVVGFSLRAYRNLGSSYMCVDSTMGLFVDTIRTTTHLTSFDETGITYLAATNAGWLPYLADEGIKFVHYLANRVRRKFGLDQDIPDAISFLMESPTSVRPFLRPTAFELWSQCFTAVIVLGSLREGLCTPAMHRYWQVVMTLFEQELVGSRDFSLIPHNGLSMVISANPCLLLPSKSVLAYTRK